MAVIGAAYTVATSSTRMLFSGPGSGGWRLSWSRAGVFIDLVLGLRGRAGKPIGRDSRRDRPVGRSRRAGLLCEALELVGCGGVLVGVGGGQVDRAGDVAD